jgi:Fe-S cluster assembly scaffold protein SufB
MYGNVTDSLLARIADLHEIPQGAHSIRKNGEVVSMGSTEHIVITPKEDVDGLDIHISGECRGESLHIPVIIEERDLQETVHNSFTIGGGADVTIVSGCGLHNEDSGESRHEGIHDLRIGKWAKVRYVENHYASGSPDTSKELNPVTTFYVDHDSTLILDMSQLGGVSRSYRKTVVFLEENATLVINERLLTEHRQSAESEILIELNGKGASAQTVSRSVARDGSAQSFTYEVVGNAESKGHIACDAIIMDGATVVSRPIVAARHTGANLIHEAAIGRLESGQLMKLMSLGMSSEDAEQMIINGFLK